MPSIDYPSAASRANSLGAAGFALSFLGLFLGGLLCPIGLIVALIAIRRRPRALAIAGVVIGLLGTLIPLLFVSLYGIAGIHSIASFLSIDSSRKPHLETINARLAANSRIQNFSAKHADQLPENADGEATIINQLDGWNHAFHYRKLSPDKFELRSAGPDGLFDTPDDEAQTFTLRAAATSPATER